MKHLFPILLILLAACDFKPLRPISVTTCHPDCFWSSVTIGCDSVNMTSDTSIIVWIDGQSSTIVAPTIR